MARLVFRQIKSYKIVKAVATNSIGAGKSVVSGSVPKHIADEIDRRAKTLDMSKSRYLAKIVEQWYASGCAPVSKQDDLMRKAETIPSTRQGRAS